VWRDVVTIVIAMDVVECIYSCWKLHYFIIVYKLVQKPRHKVHDWITEIEIYISLNRKELEMDNTQNHLHQLMDFDRK